MAVRVGAPETSVVPFVQEDRTALVRSLNGSQDLPRPPDPPEPHSRDRGIQPGRKEETKTMEGRVRSLPRTGWVGGERRCCGALVIGRQAPAVFR